MSIATNRVRLSDMSIDIVAEEFFHHLTAVEGTGTALVSAACVAGAQLMRGTGLSFDGMEPGGYVLYDALNDQGIALLDALDARLAELATEPVGDWNLPELEGTGPTESLYALTEKYEPVFIHLVEKHGVAAADRPGVAMRTAALIIHRASPIMDRELGKSIVAQALVPSVKTVPPPLA